MSGAEGKPGLDGAELNGPDLNAPDLNGPDQDGHYRLRLYVAGQTRRSVAAIANLRRIAEQHLSGRYTIEVVDLMRDPQLAAGDQILALPTLVRQLPAPLKRIIGDLSDTERVLVGLDLLPKEDMR